MPTSSNERFYSLLAAASADMSFAEQQIASDPSILEAKNGIGETVLHYLVIEDVRPTVEFLLSKGADIDSQNKFGATPLMEAASLGSIEMCKFLISKNADFRRVNPENGGTAFSHAACADELETLNYLLTLLDPNEDLNHFFSDIDAEMVLRNDTSLSAKVLLARGLIRRWTEEDV